jgi:hypothetical protein
MVLLGRGDCGAGGDARGGGVYEAKCHETRGAPRGWCLPNDEAQRAGGCGGEGECRRVAGLKRAGACRRGPNGTGGGPREVLGPR